MYLKEEIKAAIRWKDLTLIMLANKISEKLGREIKPSYLSGIINETASIISPDVVEELYAQLQPELDRIANTPLQRGIKK
jgi:hypothetical protein